MMKPRRRGAKVMRQAVGWAQIRIITASRVGRYAPGGAESWHCITDAMGHNRRTPRGQSLYLQGSQVVETGASQAAHVLASWGRCRRCGAFTREREATTAGPKSAPHSVRQKSARGPGRSPFSNVYRPETVPGLGVTGALFSLEQAAGLSRCRKALCQSAGGRMVVPPLMLAS
jgi:hypothetical protein